MGAVIGWCTMRGDIRMLIVHYLHLKYTHSWQTTTIYEVYAPNRGVYATPSETIHTRHCKSLAGCWYVVGAISFAKAGQNASAFLLGFRDFEIFRLFALFCGLFLKKRMQFCSMLRLLVFICVDDIWKMRFFFCHVYFSDFFV